MGVRGILSHHLGLYVAMTGNPAPAGLDKRRNYSVLARNQGYSGLKNV